MDRKELTSGAVAKVFQLVAVVLVGAVLGGTQCTGLCSSLSVERQAKSNQALEHEMHCHRTHSPDDSQPPASGDLCSHLELVAEKRSDASSMDALQKVSFVAVRFDAQIAPVLSSAPLTLEREPFPGFSPLALTSILRI